MTNYGKVRSNNRPEAVEVKSNRVYIASNIKQYAVEVEGYLLEGYIYDYKGYDIDEYIHTLGAENAELKNELLDTQAALCEVYELVGGME